MRLVLALVASVVLLGTAAADDAKPPEKPDLDKQVADLTSKAMALSATVDALKRDVDELKRVAPITLFVPGPTVLGAEAADAACLKAKYQGALALRPATGGTTVLCVSIADPHEPPLH